jgi:hypothetical protein
MKKAISLFTALLVLGSLTGVAQARKVGRPANDDIAAAAPISALPFEQAVALKGATLERSEPRPSCKQITGSVWFGFSVPQESNIVAELSSTFGSSVAIFEQTPEGLVESACAAGNGDPVEFKAFQERIYLVQVASTGKRQGLAELGLRISEWVDRTLWEYTYSREAEEQHVPVLYVKGKPRADNPAMYDIEIGVSQQQPVRTGINTYGLVTQPVEAELLRIPASSTHLSVKVSGRYDSSQYTCAADNGEDTCYAGTPLKDVSWLTSGEGSRAELVISLRAERNGEVLLERSIVVPYAGQAMGLLP